MPVRSSWPTTLRILKCCNDLEAEDDFFPLIVAASTRRSSALRVILFTTTTAMSPLQHAVAKMNCSRTTLRLNRFQGFVADRPRPTLPPSCVELGAGGAILPLGNRHAAACAPESAPNIPRRMNLRCNAPSNTLTWRDLAPYRPIGGCRAANAYLARQPTAFRVTPGAKQTARVFPAP